MFMHKETGYSIIALLIDYSICDNSQWEKNVSVKIRNRHLIVDNCKPDSVSLVNVVLLVYTYGTNTL